MAKSDIEVIQERQIEPVNKAMGQPICRLQVIETSNDGLVFQVLLSWDDRRWLPLHTQENKPRTFKHFWHFLKWAGAHEAAKVVLDPVEIDLPIKAALGLRLGAAAVAADSLRRAGGPESKTE